MKCWVIGAVLVVPLIVTSRVEAFRPLVPMRAYQVRLEGRLGAPRDSDKGTFDLTLGFKRKDFRLQLSELRVLSGGILPNQILNAVDPYKPNIFLRGADETLQPLLDADSDEFVEITGYLRGRDLLVSHARVLPDETQNSTESRE